MGIEDDLHGTGGLWPTFEVDAAPKKVFVERRRRPNVVRIVRWDPFDNKLANSLLPGYGGELARKFFSYKRLEGNLYLDLRPVDGDYMRIGSWEEGLKTQCWTYEYGWLDLELDFCFPLLACRKWYTGVFPPVIAGIPPQDRERSTDALESFARTIPAQICKAAAPFGICQLLVLRILRQCPAHLALVQENPALVFLAGCRMYENECNGASRTAEFVKLLYQKRRSIAEFALGRNSERTVHLLSKLRLDRYDWQAAGDIARFLDDSGLCRSLAVYKVIPEIFFRELETNPAILDIQVFGPNSEVFKNGFKRKAFCEALNLYSDCLSIERISAKRVAPRREMQGHFRAQAAS